MSFNPFPLCPRRFESPPILRRLGRRSNSPLPSPPLTSSRHGAYCSACVWPGRVCLRVCACSASLPSVRRASRAALRRYCCEETEELHPAKDGEGGRPARGDRGDGAEGRDAYMRPRGWLISLSSLSLSWADLLFQPHSSSSQTSLVSFLSAGATRPLPLLRPPSLTAPFLPSPCLVSDVDATTRLSGWPERC